MAQPYTTGDTNSTVTLSNLMVSAWDRKMRLALRAIPQFRQIADARVIQQTNPGETVTFHFYNDLQPTTDTLDEIADPAHVKIADPQRVSVTLEERGNYTVTTKRVQEFSLDGELNGNIANQIAYNQAVSINEVVQQVMEETQNSIYCTDDGAGLLGVESDLIVKDQTTGIYTGNPFDPALATGDINSEALRTAVTTLRTRSVVPVRGSMYATFIHPEVSHDIRRDTDPAGWRQPHTYVDTTELYVGEIGTWEGLIFIETPFCRNPKNRVDDAGQPLDPAAGGGAYSTYVFGREALAEAVAEEPHLVVNGNLGEDVFNRKTSVGWYGILGHSIFRPEPLIQIGSTSSITA